MNNLYQKEKDWSDEEDNKLLEEIDKKISIEDIAKIHNRKIENIKDRILYHSINTMNKNNISIEDICIKMNIKKQDLIKYKYDKYILKEIRLFLSRL